MQRRGFLQSILAAIGAGAATSVRAAPLVVTPPLLIQESPLAGFHYHSAPQLWNQLRVEDSLRLVREPDNPHDPRAVALYWQEHRVGYLPRVENCAVSQMLDRGEPMNARIIELNEGWDPWDRIHVSVWREES